MAGTLFVFYRGTVFIPRKEKRYFVKDMDTWKYKRETGPAGLQAYVVKHLAGHKPSIVVVKVTKANVNGVSDLLLCVLGKFVAIELKVEDNKPTLQQIAFLKNVKAADGITGVAYTWGEVKRIIMEAGYDCNGAPSG